MELKKVIGENIKRFRENADMQQNVLAQKIGKCYSWVSHAEKGRKNISVETLEAIASALKVAVADLVTMNSVSENVSNDWDIDVTFEFNNPFYERYKNHTKSSPSIYSIFGDKGDPLYIGKFH